ncbi:hypothetical protein BKA70DRAFT_1396490 [Coprinopsis sp. MPI-PUGE-AT-0042]|nr:hypothetical protein BKA70DRAFT_1396490 [Coprinopsis sp. MPI-PUGE-AT-0042]
MSKKSQSPPPATRGRNRSESRWAEVDSNLGGKRNDFDLEPNPFEQSFATGSSSNVRNASPNNRDSNGSSSADSNKMDTSGPNDVRVSRPPSRTSHNRSASPSRPVLPPLASISSPADPSYAWGASYSDINSLRSGPLSPAMLAGPQGQPSSQPPHITEIKASDLVSYYVQGADWWRRRAEERGFGQGRSLGYHPSSHGIPGFVNKKRHYHLASEAIQYSEQQVSHEIESTPYQIIGLAHLGEFSSTNATSPARSPSYAPDTPPLTVL